MSLEYIIHYATLFWLLMGATTVAVAVVIHREQVKTQIFLALSARYDELLQSASMDFWLGMPGGTVLPERSEALAILALRFCTLVSLGYYLFREHRIPKRMWLLLLSSAERRIRSPLFVREWEHLRSEFESYPEFVALVASVQHLKERQSTEIPDAARIGNHTHIGSAVTGGTDRGATTSGITSAKSHTWKQARKDSKHGK